MNKSSLSMLLLLTSMSLVGCATSKSTSSGTAVPSEDNLPAKEFTASRPVVWTALKDSVGELGWKVTTADETTGVLTARTPMTIWTWGDSVTVVASELPAGTVRVHVTSSTGQAVDWGKNRKNIEALYAKLDAKLQAATSQK